jgi:hypothetical protein
MHKRRRLQALQSRQELRGIEQIHGVVGEARTMLAGVGAAQAGHPPAILQQARCDRSPDTGADPGHDRMAA